MVKKEEVSSCVIYRRYHKIFLSRLKKLSKCRFILMFILAIFGQKLADTMLYEARTSNRKVPRIVEMCVEFLLNNGVEMEGIFRYGFISNLQRVTQVKSVFFLCYYYCSSLYLVKFANLESLIESKYNTTFDLVACICLLITDECKIKVPPVIFVFVPPQKSGATNFSAAVVCFRSCAGIGSYSFSLHICSM